MVIHVQICQFFFVFVFLRIVDREELHEVVGGVCELWHGSLDRFEVVDRAFSVTLVHDPTVAHENEFVEVEEGLRGGRVDRAHHSFALRAGQPLQQHADAEGLEGVETRGWLVKQEDRRVRDKFHANRAPLSFTAREDLALGISDLTA